MSWMINNAGMHHLESPAPASLLKCQYANTHSSGCQDDEDDDYVLDCTIHMYYVWTYKSYDILGMLSSPLPLPLSLSPGVCQKLILMMTRPQLSSWEDNSRKWWTPFRPSDSLSRLVRQGKRTPHLSVRILHHLYKSTIPPVSVCQWKLSPEIFVVGVSIRQ